MVRGFRWKPPRIAEFTSSCGRASVSLAVPDGVTDEQVQAALDRLVSEGTFLEMAKAGRAPAVSVSCTRMTDGTPPRDVRMVAVPAEPSEFVSLD